MLTSLDYADLISWIAYKKYGILLNKTQMNKLLFMCYGMYLAASGGRVLFEDDSPKAWPFGPVFPRVNKRFNPEVIPTPFSAEKQENFKANKMALQLVDRVVEKYHGYSAYTLSEWSHKEGGPWHTTIYGKDGEKKAVKWNQPIENDLIKEYFTPRNAKK